MTTWLSRLTRYDISGVDVSDCDSIDSWLVRLRDETPLDVGASSGSSGTCSFYPKSKRDYFLSMWGMRVQLAQKFGEDPRPAISPTDPRDHPVLQGRPASMGAFGNIFHGLHFGDPDYWHYCLIKLSSDFMWLAACLRAAAAKGDVSKVDVPPLLRGAPNGKI
jgi:hypothetical protein